MILVYMFYYGGLFDNFIGVFYGDLFDNFIGVFKWVFNLR